MTPRAYRYRHALQRTTADADQAELEALRLGSANFERGIYDDRVADALDDFEPDAADRPSWQTRDMRDEAATGRVREHIEARAKILGTLYPFELEDRKIVYRKSQTSVYEFCLAICLAPSITKGGYTNLPRQFERLCANLVRAYLGENSDAVHTGHPRETAVGKNFQEAVRHLNDKAGEWNWSPEDGLPENPHEKDAGVDFVAWKIAPDGRRISQLFVLGQCACGNDWNLKLNDLNLANLGKWVRPLPFVAVRAFATPFSLVDEVLHDSSRFAGLFFDRLRLVRIAGQVDDWTVINPSSTELQSLVDLVLKA